MRFIGFSRSPLVARVAAIGVVAGIAAITNVPSAVAAPCFDVAANIVCMDTEIAVPMPPMFPPILIPVSSSGEGIDEDIVIRDDGGQHVARG